MPCLRAEEALGITGSSFIRSHRTDYDLNIAGSRLPVAAWTHAARTAPAAVTRAHRAAPILMIHGFRGDHHGMDLLAHYLRDHRVIVPDLPGFGQTPPLPPGTGLTGFTETVEALHTAITAQYGTTPLVVGHSFGSIVVAHWAKARAAKPARHTDTGGPGQTGHALAGLALINPIVTPALEGPSRLGTQLTRLYYQAARHLPAPAAHRLLASPLIVRGMSQVMATTGDPGLRRYIHDQHARYFSAFADPTSLAEAFDTSVSYNVGETADALSMPLAVIAGRRDLIAPIQATRGFVGSLPRARLLELDVGHLVHYEAPEAAARFISTFAKEL